MLVSTIDNIFIKISKRYSNNTAIVSEDGNYRLSYHDLNSFSNVICFDYIKKYNLDYNDYSIYEYSTASIAIMTERNFAMIVAIIAVLKSDAAYVPVDPSFPPDRQSHIFTHSQSQLLLADESSYEKALKLGVKLPPVLLLDAWSGRVLSDILINSPEIPRTIDMIYRESGRDSLGIAYVLYTSGSTGKPKGVMVRHQGVINVIRWFSDALRIGSYSVVLGLTTFCFDISVLEMFIPLLSGGTLVIADSATQKDPFRLIDVIRDRKVTVLQATPTTYEMLLATGWQGDSSLDMLVGGEAFRPSLVPLITNSRSLRNVYGPTETTIWSSCYDFGGRVPEAVTTTGHPVIPIGTPISKTIFYVVAVAEAEGGREPPYRLAARGEEGELWIGGVGVAKGYIHDPCLSDERFLRDPFVDFGVSGSDNAVYRTGDLVRQLEDGNYIFIRRLDDQVKANGYRIELAEVEAALGSAPAVLQAVVVVRDGQLVAYVRTREGARLCEAERARISGWAARMLPSYMLPRLIVGVDHFPQTANSKLDRNALPYPPPSSSVQVQLQSGSGSEAAFGPTDKGPGPVDSETDPYPCEQEGREAVTETSTLISSASLTMLEHVSRIVLRVRGQRPPPHASFAAVGIDSLGSVLLLTALSQSLGGLRIDLQTVYGPGVTVASFSEVLYSSVRRDCPEVLDALGVVAAVSVTSKRRGEGSGRENTDDDDKRKNNDLERSFKSLLLSNGSAMDGSNNFNAQNEDNKSKDILLEESLDDRVFANKFFFEGIRGVLTIMVLWNHFHNSELVVSFVWKVDTSLFLMLSGFTTMLQMHQSHESSSDTTDANDMELEDDLDLEGSNIDDEFKGTQDTKKSALKSNTCSRYSDLKTWNWKTFLLSRAVGLFPLLWFTLLVNAPRWHLRTFHYFIADSGYNVELLETDAVQRHLRQVEAFCGVLYATGFQSIQGPHCRRNYGPYDTLYASFLWIDFVIFAFIQFLISFVYRQLLHRYKKNTTKHNGFVELEVHNSTSTEPSDEVTSKSRSGLSGRHSRANHGLTDWVIAAMGGRLSSRVYVLFLVLRVFALLVIIEFTKKSVAILTYFFIGVICAELVQNWSKVASILPSYPEPSVAFATHATDVFIGLAALLIGASDSHEIWFTSLCIYYIVPLLFGASLVTTLLQPRHTRVRASIFCKGLWRTLCESKAMTTLGYASYPIYLLQNVILNFYFRIFYEGMVVQTFFSSNPQIIDHETDDVYRAYWDNRWFGNQPDWWKAAGFVAVVAIGWAVQKYFQDGFVADLVARIMLMDDAACTTTTSLAAAASPCARKVRRVGAVVGSASASGAWYMSVFGSGSGSVSDANPDGEGGVSNSRPKAR